MKAYRCNRCCRSIITDLDEWAPCRVCGSREWAKLTNIRYPEMVRILIRTRFRLIIPPQGSWLEAICKRYVENVTEVCPTQRRRGA